MKKGISTVIGVILMLMIVIALSGTAYLYISGVFTSKTATTFSIIDSIGYSVTIRNDGTVPINKISATLDGDTVNLIYGEIEPGQIMQIRPNLPSPLSPGTHTLRLCTSNMCNIAYLTIREIPVGSSCLDILNSGNAWGDGIYEIDPEGSGAFQVYCDMSTDGGGWTLAAVCRPEDNPNYPDYNPGVPNSDCWNTGKVGSVLDPNSPTSTKLSDSSIRAILLSGEKTTRAHWNQQYRYNRYNPTDHWVYNLLSDPSQWDSTPCGSNGKEFFVKYNYEDSWGSALYSQGTSCSCAVDGWSNTRIDSCGSLGTWSAGCEKAPSSSHCCACQTYDERANLVVWIR